MFYDSFDSLFEKLWNNFSRPVHDQFPYKAIKKENGFLIVVNTLGLGKDDVKVGIEKKKGMPYPVLSVKGTTTIENIGFENTVNIGIKLNIDETEIDSVKYEVKNGLTTIFVKLKEVKSNTITAEYADGSLDF